MKKVVWLLAVAVFLCLGTQPISAGGCPPNSSCVGIGVGDTAEDIADDVGQNWNLPDYACSSSGASIEIEGENGTRGIEFGVDGDGTADESHTLDLTLAATTESGEPPFDIFADFDEAGPILLRDGTTNFGQIDLTVSTAPPGSTTNLPLLSPRRTVLLVAGLLAAGIAILVFRRGA